MRVCRLAVNCVTGDWDPPDRFPATVQESRPEDPLARFVVAIVAPRARSQRVAADAGPGARPYPAARRFWRAAQSGFWNKAGIECIFALDSADPAKVRFDQKLPLGPREVLPRQEQCNQPMHAGPHGLREGMDALVIASHCITAGIQQD